MASTRKLTATLPSGEVVTRRTARTYTHVVARKLTYTDGSSTGWHCTGWCGRPDLAEKQMAQFRKGDTPGCQVLVGWDADRAPIYKTLERLEVVAAPVGV